MKLFLKFGQLLLSQRVFYCSTKELNNMMQHLEKGMLLNCSGKLVNAGKAYLDKKIIAYYFSASWCNPCKQLLPKIKDIYTKSKEINSGLEIIYISSDKNPDDMIKYFKERHGGWYAVPFDDNGGETLRKLYEVTHVPKIVVVKNDGAIISKTGVKDVDDMGVEVLQTWNSDPKSNE